MLISLQFHLRRHLQLLRRAWSSLRANGWRATWHRAALRPAVEIRPGASSQPISTPVPPVKWGEHPWILLVDVSTPEPDQDSGSLRLSNLMRVLISAGYRLAFLPDDGRTDGPQADALRAHGVHVPRLAGAHEIPAWLRRHGRTLATAILCRHHTAGHWLPLVRSTAPRARVVFDTVDLHYLREQREAELNDDRRLQRFARATRRRELGLVARADTTWVVSPIERELLLQACPRAAVRVLSNIIEVDAPGRPFESRRDLLFVGGLRHPPNRDAVEWLVGDIFPRIREALPDVELHLVGSFGGCGAVAGSASEPGIHAHGHVPDLVPYLAGCRVALAPLRFGAGVKGKVNLSMAHGQPVVATTCATEGMHLQPGTDVLVADDAETLAAEVVRLYRDPALWRRLSDQGRANVRRHFSPEAAIAVAMATLGPPRTLPPTP